MNGAQHSLVPPPPPPLILMTVKFVKSLRGYDQKNSVSRNPESERRKESESVERKKDKQTQNGERVRYRRRFLRLFLIQ